MPGAAPVLVACRRKWCLTLGIFSTKLVGEEIVVSAEELGTTSDKRSSMASRSESQAKGLGSARPNATKIAGSAGDEKAPSTDTRRKGRSLNSQMIPPKTYEGIKLRSRRMLPTVTDIVPSSVLSDFEGDVEKRDALKGMDDVIRQAKRNENVKSLSNKEVLVKETVQAEPEKSPNSIIEDIRSASEYRKLFETPNCQHSHRKKAIEKSVKKVAAWLVTSREDGMTKDCVEIGDNEKGIQEQSDDLSPAPMPPETEEKRDVSGNQEETNVPDSEERRQDLAATSTPSDRGRTERKTGQSTQTRSDGEKGQASAAKSKASGTKIKGSKSGTGSESEKGGGKDAGTARRVEGAVFLVPTPFKSEARGKGAEKARPNSGKSVKPATREAITPSAVGAAQSRSNASPSPRTRKRAGGKDEDGKRRTEEGMEAKKRTVLEEGGDEEVQAVSAMGTVLKDEQNKKKKKKGGKEKTEEEASTTAEEGEITSDGISKTLSGKETGRKKGKHKEAMEKTVNEGNATAAQKDESANDGEGSEALSSRRKKEAKTKKKGDAERSETDTNRTGEEEGISNGGEESGVKAAMTVRTVNAKDTRKKGKKVASAKMKTEASELGEQENAEADTSSKGNTKESKKRRREGKSEKEGSGRVEGVTGDGEGTQRDSAKNLGETDEKDGRKKRKTKHAAGKEVKENAGEEENANAGEDQTDVTQTVNQTDSGEKDKKKKKKRKEKARQEDENIGKDFQSNPVDRSRENDEIEDSDNKAKKAKKKKKKKKKRKSEESGERGLSEDIGKRDIDKGAMSECEKSNDGKASTPERTFTEKKSKKRRKQEASNELSAKKRKENVDSQSNVDIDSRAVDSSPGNPEGNQTSQETLAAEIKDSVGRSEEDTEEWKKKKIKKEKRAKLHASSRVGSRQDLSSVEQDDVPVEESFDSAKSSKTLKRCAAPAPVEGDVTKRPHQKRNSASSNICQEGSVVEDSGYDGEASRENSSEIHQRSRDCLVKTAGQGAELHRGKSIQEESGAQRGTIVDLTD